MRLPSRLARPLTLAAAAAVLLAACGGADGEEGAADTSAAEEASDGDEMASDDEMSDDGSHSDEMSDDEMSEDEAAGDELLGVTATAPDGSTFTIGDFGGETVLVETFATWCSNCRSQLGDTQDAAATAGDDAVFLALSVETSLDPAELEQYAADNGFDDIRFGVLDEEALAVLQSRYGGAVLTPPSTPKFRVEPDGSASDLTTGFESAEEILSSLGA